MARLSEGTEPLLLERQGLWIALCMDIIPYSQLFEDSRVCPRMVSTSLCNDSHRLSHLLCRYGWSQSFYSVSNSAHQNLKLFKNLNIFRASSGIRFNQLEEL